MNGWRIIFAGASTASGIWGSYVHDPAVVFTSVLFGGLFVLALCAKAVRGAAC
jgi:hypothetical protein